ERIAGEVEYRAPKIRIISNLTGKAARTEEMAAARYWREHMRSMVLFDAGLRAALETGCRTFIEIGPQPHLMALGKSTHSGADIAWLPSIRKGRNAWLDILAAVQALYLQGAEIDWKALHGKSGRPLALPTYPFERERHWFRAKKAQPARERSIHGHPLLGERVHSPLAKIQFESRFDSGRPVYLGDHIAAGHRIVPAAAYLEMALSAAAAFKKQAALRDVSFLRPCIFDEPRILQCVLDEKDNRSTFVIYSRPEGDVQDEWSLHATGEVSVDAEPHAGENVARVEIDAIRKRCTEEIGASAFYGAFEESGAHFGPSFRPVTKISRSSTEALVEFDFVSEVRDDAALYRIHPVALDACFQAVVALLMNSTEHAVHLPAGLESLRISGDPRKLVAAHAEIRDAHPGAQLTADVRGFDAAGNVLVRAEGLMLRPMQPPRGERGPDSLSNAFYEVAWVPVRAAAEREIEFGGTCVLAGDEILARSFAASLEGSGARTLVLPSANGSSDKAERDYDAEFAQITRQRSAPISDFFYIAPRVTEDGLRLQSDRWMQLEAKILGECMRIAQALLRVEQKETPRLWIVTRGAQGPAMANVAESALWGFGRAVAAEHPEMRVVRIDLDPADGGEALLRALPMAIIEEELVLRGTEMCAPRLRPVQLRTEKTDRLPEQHESNLRLELVRPGTLEGIEAVSSRRTTPGPGEVEIQVAAAGLNFRDVLSALGMYPGKNGALGGECAGTVVAVGAGVESLRPGDEVVALGQGCFAEFVTTRADMVWPKPANLSFEAAVTIPVTFLTAWYGLKTIAAIQPGESVLIHSGAGGVGLAAIQVAQKAGAAVFATAGSQEKRDYLSSIGVRYVFDSRSLDFVREVASATDGRGVDVVLNSLAGKFVDAGFEALAPGGRFIEIGVADIRSAESVARVRPDIAYRPFNLAPALQSGDKVVREIIKVILEQFQAGDLQALPRKIFPLKDGREAFRTMAQARHIGRVVITPEKLVSRRGIRQDGAYLVTGGLSGVGLAVAEWLAKSGAAQVIAMGRRPAAAAALELFEKLRNPGTVISVCQGDVTKEADVRAAFGLVKKYPLRGIFHCAGVLDDGVLLQQNWERFERVLAPKIAGAWNLLRLSADLPLDHFVLFSSVASVFGSPGQTNYAAANAFLDGLAQYRHSQGLPALSINWGAWSETGTAVRHGVLERESKLGMKGISTGDGLAALKRLIAGTHPQVTVAPMDWEKYLVIAGAEASRPFFSDLKKSNTRAEGVRARQDFPSRTKNSSWLPQLRDAVPTRRMDLLLGLLEERVQTTLGIHSTQAIDPNQPLQELGLDSLLSIELRNSLSASLERSLPATLLFNYPTLGALAPFLLRQVLGESAKGGRRNGSGNADYAAPADLVHDIESMSDEEVERLLNARAMEGAK
ncbi:MAG: SDR family NAD(P)-dependent oxidoreductase, partial [Acidobacteriaceae bacterium]